MKKKIIAVIFAAMLMTSGLSGCGNNNTAVSVGKSDISKSDFQYYLDSVKEYMAGTELTSEEDWSTKEIEGKKAIDAAKEKALDTAVNNRLYIEIGKIKTPLSEDEKKGLDDFRQNMIKRLGNEEEYNKFLESNGMTNEFFNMLYESETYRRKLAELIKAEEPASDDEIKKVFLKNYRRAKHILIMTTDAETRQPLSEDKQADAKKRADELYQRVKNGEDFDKLMNEYSEDPGSKTNPDGYVFTDKEMVSEFQDGVDSLANGEVCMVESIFGYHIIKRYAIDETPELYNKFYTNVKAKLEELVYNNKLEAKLEDWKKECGIEVKVNESYYKDLK